MKSEALHLKTLSSDVGSAENKVNDGIANENPTNKTEKKIDLIRCSEWNSIDADYRLKRFLFQTVKMKRVLIRRRRFLGYLCFDLQVFDVLHSRYLKVFKPSDPLFFFSELFSKIIQG